MLQGTVRNKPTRVEHIKRVYCYIKRKILWKRKYWKRPLEIQITWICRACHLTYDEVRYDITKLIKQNYLKKFTVYDRPCHCKTRYQLVVDKAVDNSKKPWGLTYENPKKGKKIG